MREASYFILASLMGSELHGYGVAKRSEQLSEGRVRLSSGTLYGALDRLVSEGLIEVAGETKVAGRRRRNYRITEAGRAAAIAEVARMRSAAAAVDRSMEIGQAWA